jgi:hypothetical protein
MAIGGYARVTLLKRSGFKANGRDGLNAELPELKGVRRWGVERS